MKTRMKKLTALSTLTMMLAGWHPIAWAQEIEEIIVQARLKSSAEELIGERMDNDVVMDAIDAEFISRVGDSTVAAALRRVSGLSLVDNKFVYVRGLGERYSSTLLNGSTVPSPDLTRSVIPLDLFPTSIVESLAVQKGYSADMTAAFGGGSVDIRTKSIPDQFTWGIDVGMGIDSENESDHLSYAGGDDDKWGSDDGTRELSPVITSAMREYQGSVEVQNLLSAMQARGMADATLEGAQALNRSLALELNRNLSIKEESDDPNYDLKGHIGNNFYLTDDWEVGFLASGSYKRGWDDTETVARNFQFPDERFEIENESARKTDLHGSINLGVRFTEDHAIETMSLYLRNTDDETSIRDYFNENREKSDGIGFREYRIKLEERDLVANQIMGEHILGAATRERLPQWDWLNWIVNKLPEESQVTWRYSESRAGTSIPGETTIAGVNNTDPVTGRTIESTVDLDTRAAVYRFTDLEDEVENGAWGWTIPLTTEESLVELSGGYEWSRKVRLYRQQQFSLGAFSVASDSVLQGSLADVFSDTNILDTGNDFIFGVPGANNQSYIAATTTDAIYGKVDWTWNEQWRVMAGLRWEDYGQVALDWNLNGYTIEQPAITTDVEALERAVFKDDEIYPSIAGGRRDKTEIFQETQPIFWVMSHKNRSTKKGGVDFTYFTSSHVH